MRSAPTARCGSGIRVEFGPWHPVPSSQRSDATGPALSGRNLSVPSRVVTLATGTITEEPESSSPRAWGGPLFGIGAILHVARHVALVPEMRAIWYPAAERGNSLVRAAVSGRWIF